MPTLTRDPPPEDEGEYHGSEMIMIDPKTDIFDFQVPLGPGDVKIYKERAAHALAHMIVDKIDPEFKEMEGFEMMSFTLVIKKYDK